MKKEYLSVWKHDEDIFIQFANRVQGLTPSEAKKLKLNLDLVLHVPGDICQDQVCDEYGY